MRKIAVFFLIFAFSIGVQAQSDTWYFSFSMGGSWPEGSFSQTNISSKESGYAKKGFALLLDATYPLNDHWGFKGMTLISTNPVDRASQGAELEARMNAVSITVAEADRDFISLRANAWMWNALLAGPVYTIPVNRINWDIQLLGGMNVAYLPQQKLQYEKPASNWFYLDRNTTTTNVSYGVLAGTALRFPVSDRLNLRVGLDYYQSKATVHYEQIKVSKQGETVVTQNLGSGSSLVPIKMISGSIGFVYYLN